MTQAPAGGDVRLNGIDVRYRAAGSGPAVVLVHGLGEDGGAWERQQAELTGWRTYAYDLRGHGGSGLGEAEGSLAQLRDDLLAFLREVTGPAVCAGFSLGGTVVLSAAAAAPELVTGAVVFGTSTVVGKAAVEFYEERIALVRGGDRQRLASAMRADTVAALYGTDGDVDAVTARRMAAIGDGGGYANAAAAMAGLRERPLTPQLAAVKCPVVVVGAAQDTFCPRRAADIMLDGLAAAPCEVTYEEIPDAGHLMNVERPAAVTDRLRAALASMR
ncbi:alpha/beta hydrolase [Streptomyces sp. Ru73]|uniref:alpha/beta fold hydrolase n=1 Tax=Streptomyces sp. Ru73 TaxID=2080748 RepID=UPI000CDDF705|nr:alpha/beta hydrolase [Streptomyces sp. Ru73]POX40031.1 alpha/beta hydrolase [Streptomyces sp. Ru73]